MLDSVVSPDAPAHPISALNDDLLAMSFDIAPCGLVSGHDRFRGSVTVPPQGHRYALLRPRTTAMRGRTSLRAKDFPQARLENFGTTAVSDTELLAMILTGNGIRTEQAVNLASRLIAEAGSIAGLISWTPPDYRRMKGIGRIKALQLAAIAEISRRMMTTARAAAPLLNRAEAIAAHLAPTVAGLEVEKFWVLCLNRKNRLLKQVEITSGTATAALAHPREVFRAAIRESASAIVCAHNHPSGDPAPSAPDMHVTRVLREAARAVEIELIDHVIVGRSDADPLAKGYFSFREAGIL